MQDADRRLRTYSPRTVTHATSWRSPIATKGTQQGGRTAGTHTSKRAIDDGGVRGPRVAARKSRTSRRSLGRTAYDAARRRNVGGAKLDWAYAMVLLGEGRTAEARQQLDAVGTPAAFTRERRASTLQRRTSSTESCAPRPSGWSRTSCSTARTERNRRVHTPAICSHARCCCRGRPRGGAKTTRRSAATAGTTALRRAGGMRGSWAAPCSSASATSRGASRCSNSSSSGDRTLSRQNCYHTLAGEIALAEGKPGEAVQQLRRSRGAISSRS